jgi:hypothetical protein
MANEIRFIDIIIRETEMEQCRCNGFGCLLKTIQQSQVSLADASEQKLKSTVCLCLIPRVIDMTPTRKLGTSEDGATSCLDEANANLRIKLTLLIHVSQQRVTYYAKCLNASRTLPTNSSDSAG